VPVPDDIAAYYDTTGCGNSLNADSVAVLKLIMDSLRYWVEQMHVDGFRFDLAATLGREGGAFERTSAFFDIIAQDPVLATVKLIAEPWDVGQGDSYDVGRFPANVKRVERRIPRHRAGLLARHRGPAASLYATRTTGSSDLYGGWLRRPTASVNFLTAHDGFTLADLVSYDTKHNEANLEANGDGTDGNLSWNRGAEGPTTDPVVLASRAQASGRCSRRSSPHSASLHRGQRHWRCGHERPGPLVSPTFGLLALAAFGYRQATEEHPLTLPFLLRNRGFRAGLAMGWAFFSVVAGLS